MDTQQDVVIRAFDVKHDFDAAWNLMRSTWYRGVEPKIAAALSGDEICFYLVRATFAVSAWRNEELFGFTFARHGLPSATQQANWDRARALVNQQYGEVLAAIPDEEGYQCEIDAYRQMLAQAQLKEDDSVLLLVVNPAARGLGLGKKLFTGALDYLRAAGAQSAHLVTDTDCDWSFYDHLGLTRLAERHNDSPTALQSDGYFLYGYNFEDESLSF